MEVWNGGIPQDIRADRPTARLRCRRAEARARQRRRPGDCSHGERAAFSTSRSNDNTKSAFADASERTGCTMPAAEEPVQAGFVSLLLRFMLVANLSR